MERYHLRCLAVSGGPLVSRRLVTLRKRSAPMLFGRFRFGLFRWERANRHDFALGRGKLCREYTTCGKRVKGRLVYFSVSPH